MGIFKDLFRDISESKMTMCELEIKWAQEKEAERDWSGAGYQYEQAKEWERAGDAYLQGWKKKEGGCEFYGPKNASKCYYEAKNYDKMREAYQECLWTNVWERNRAVVAAYETGEYSYQQIGKHFGVHFTTVGRIVRAARKGQRKIGRKR